MTRKKRRESQAVNTAPETPPARAGAGNYAEPESSEPVQAPAEPLMGEVQSFLSKRAELARKLADEIEATERKLAELKKTAAMLFPESHAGAPKERKPKKPKPKAAPREDPVEPAANDSPTADAAA